MPSQVDPQLAAALAAAAEGSAGIPAPAPGDWKALRARANAGQAYLASLIAPSANVTISTCAAAATDSTPVALRWYTRRGPAPGSAVIYAQLCRAVSMAERNARDSRSAISQVFRGMDTRGSLGWWVLAMPVAERSGDLRASQEIVHLPAVLVVIGG
jgi:hypothetical protein